MITVLGLGFVGLTTALGFAEKGFKVYGYDVNKEKISLISNKTLPFHEEGLAEILEKNLNKNFIITNDLKIAIENSKIIFLCVGTPSDEDGKADLKYIKLAIDDILNNISGETKKIIVIKSTIPPSTTKIDIWNYIETKGYVVGKDIYLANNPEFLREGHAWQDFIQPDRIVIGSEDEYSKTEMEKIYKSFNAPIYFVSLNTGEFIKYLSNTLLSTLISYSNEMSMIASVIGDVDIKKSFKILSEDKRWSGQPASMSTYVYPGCGFGGYCLPKDTLAMAFKAKEYGVEAKILNSVLDVNSNIKSFWVDKISKEIGAKSRIGFLGLSFKPCSDDIRQTPAKEIIELYIEKGFNNICAYDPLANELFDKTYSLPIVYKNTIAEVCNDSDVIIILTGWQEFVEKQDLLKNKKVYDLRYILKRDDDVK